MKISKVVFASVLFLLCCVFTCHGAGTRVLVIPFGDTTGELRGVEQDLTAAVIEEIKASGKFIYISADQFAENWLKGAVEKDKKLLGPDLANRMKDLKSLKPMFSHDELGTIAEYKDRWGVDLVIIGEIRKENGAMKLYSEIIGMSTGRFYSLSGECQPGLMKDEARRQARLALSKGDAVQEIGADRELEAATSVVAYDMKTMEGEDLWLVADYTARRPDPELQNMDIAPASPLRDGVKFLKVETVEGKPIEFQYFYKDGQLASINIATSPPAVPTEGEFSETLAVKSKAGHPILFTFQWKRGELKGVRAEPAANPFSEVK